MLCTAYGDHNTGDSDHQTATCSAIVDIVEGNRSFTKSAFMSVCLTACMVKSKGHLPQRESIARGCKFKLQDYFNLQVIKLK